MTEIATPASIAPASAKAVSSGIRVWDLPLRLFH